MASITLRPTKDTYVSSYSPTANYGSDDDMQCTGTSSIGRRPLVEFDISSLVGATITSAILHMYSFEYSGTGTENFYIRRATSTFVESTVTWNTKPAYTDINKATTSIEYGIGWHDWTITGILDDAVDLSLSELDIYAHTESESGHLGFRSRDYSIAFEPYISVVYSLDDYYVRASGGNDSNSGTSWANAWATVNKGMVTIASGKTLHIGFDENSHADWYDSEPADNKLSPDASNVTVVYETAVTGGGTGYAKVEVN